MLPLAALLACHSVDKDGSPADSGTPAEDPECAEAEARLGYRACVPRIPDDDTFNGVTVGSSSVDQLRVGKYLVPATDDARLPGLFVDVNAFPLHYDFLVTAFPDLFAGLTTDEYQSLTLYPDTRELYAGTYSIYIDDDGYFYGFTVWDDPADPSSTVTMEQVTQAWEELQDRFEVGELAWVPNSSAQEEEALGWDDAPFPIRNPAEVTYEVYNPGEAYGYLRLYTIDEFSDATDEASYGYQDIVVVDEAPEDILRVVSGVVTGTRQGTLSHLNVRSAMRGTPNCYVDAPLEALADWKDQLVHFTCGDTDYTVESATTDEAQAWWDSIRPDPVEICAPDLSVTAMPGLLELDTQTAEARHANLCAYGAKGSNLATLYQRIDDAWQLDGFTIPFSYYDAFVNGTSWNVDLGSGVGSYTFQETLDAWHADPDFLTDAALRKDRLDQLRDAMQTATVDPAIVDAVAARIVEVFGDDLTMVRLRSSSNAEDGLDFSGAGLYISDSACVADEYDGDEDGPSLCDPDKENEQTVTDALRDVWASLWDQAAWEERDWYGIDQSQVVMGLLCDTRSNDEQANIVAFSGNPTSAGDDRYLVNAQEGELEVVSAEPGVYPEKTLLTLDGGVVTDIDRVSPSSETDEVLTDAELAELGAELYVITTVYPLDYEVPEGHDILWDTEWKIDHDGQMKVKQIRPFLR